MCLCALSASGRYDRCYENQVFPHNYLLIGRHDGCNIRCSNLTVIYLLLPAALCLGGAELLRLLGASTRLSWFDTRLFGGPAL